MFMSKKLFTLTALTLPLLASAISVGDKFSNSVPIVDRRDNVFYDVPLPKGEWEVSYIRHRTTNNTNQGMVDIGLGLIEDNFLKIAIEITSVTSSTQTRWTDEPCKIDPVFYKNDYGTRLWQQKCLTLNATTFLQNNNQPTRDAIDKLVQRGIKNDFNAVRFVYTRYGDLGKLLIYRIFYFPSVYKLENPVQGNLNASPWYPARVAQDPEKSKFMDELVKYSEAFVDEINSYYEGKGQLAGTTAFSYPPVKQAILAAPAPVNAPIEDLESKLKKLLSLRDSGLITPQEYEGLRAKAISGN
jgi:hypothetical protein